jgi:hypothetical protein
VLGLLSTAGRQEGEAIHFALCELFSVMRHISARSSGITQCIEQCTPWLQAAADFADEAVKVLLDAGADPLATILPRNASAPYATTSAFTTHAASDTAADSTTSSRAHQDQKEKEGEVLLASAQAASLHDAQVSVCTVQNQRGASMRQPERTCFAA